MAYSYFSQAFDYFESKGRKRPSRVKGYVPVTPNSAPNREDVLPMALYKKNMEGYPDLNPHNTVRGHLIGLDSLGGEEENRNLVPMYGQFNLSTYKVKFENVLKQKVQVHGVKSAELELIIHYDDIKCDPRVPTAFSYTLSVINNEDVTTTHSDYIAHTAPEAAYQTPASGLSKYIATKQKSMERAAWWVEDVIENREGAKLHFEDGQPLNVPPKDYAQRPYAVLDYILYEREEGKYFGVNCAPEIYNGGTFSQPQIDAILTVNLAKHDGYYKSDDIHDYVYSGNEYMFKYPDNASSYYLHAHASSGKQDGVLLMDGYHQKPEIDHIVMKGKHLNPGCNAYSNARVISRYLNSEDRGKYT